MDSWRPALLLFLMGTGCSIAAVAETNSVLRDIKPPVAIPLGWIWLWRILGALAILAIAYALWRWKRNRPAPPAPPPVPPHVKARKALEQALRLLSQPKEFCIHVSDILRIYLEERFDFRAPERTTEEFLVELQGTGLLTEKQKVSLGDFLARCDLVKFARYEPTEQELLDLHNSASRIVQETAPSEIAPSPKPPSVGTSG